MRRRMTVLGALAAMTAVATASTHVHVAMHKRRLVPVNVSSTSAPLGVAFNSETPDQTTQSSNFTGSMSAHIQWQIRSGQTKSRGVNLGGWLVAEHWMTPSAEFWKGVSSEHANSGEYTAIVKSANQDATRVLIDKHHATFITEADIKAIADAGLNTVRVPVGYWIVGFDDTDFARQKEWNVHSKNSIKYLDLLVKTWAKKHNVAVLISIHAAKGSQNGADHSSPSVNGKAYWSEYKENVQNTIDVASFLAARYMSEDAFLGIGLLNEPNGPTKEDVLYQYYQDAYKAIRGTGNDCVLSVAPLLSKQNPDTMVGFMEAPQFKNVWVEWHPYFVWGYEQTSESDLVSVSVKREFQGKVTKWHARANHNRLFFGEWSFATVAGKFDASSSNRNQFYEFAEAQAKVHNQAEGGWTFWSWKSTGDEGGFNGWSLRSVLRDDKLKAFLLSS